MALKDRARGFDERQQQFLECAATASARCAAILGEVDDLLRVENAFAARLMPFERASVNLLALLEEAISSLPEAPEFVSVELRPSEGIVFVQADAARLRKAFSTIIDRVRRLVIGREPIWITERAGTYQGNPASRIVIAEATHIERLDSAPVESFGPFYESSVSHIVARRMIELHNGAIWSPGDRSEPGAVVLLPRA